MSVTSYNIGDKVQYYVRWDDDLRVGTIARVGAKTIWIGCNCMSLTDIRWMRLA